MKIIYKQSDDNSTFNEHGIHNCYFKLLSTKNDIKRASKKIHHHKGFEIHIINKGYQIYETKDGEHRINEGNMLIIPPGMAHCFKSSDTDILKYAVIFELDEISHDFQTDRYIITTIPASIQNNIQKILTEHKSNLFFSRQLLENSLFDIIVHILRLAGYKEDTVTKSNTEENFRLLIAKHYINDNIEFNLKISDVAAHCYLSTKQLTRLFKNCDGAPPANYIRTKKIEYAEQLINTGVSFAEISEKMNFSSQYHFNSFFKKYSGMTPGAYRDSLLQ